MLHIREMLSPGSLLNFPLHIGKLLSIYNMIDGTIFVNKILHLQTEYFLNFSKKPIRRGFLIVDVKHRIIITLHIFVDEAYLLESAASD